MQHHAQMSTATKVELELARQRAEKAMAGETGLQQTWGVLPSQHRDMGTLRCSRGYCRCAALPPASSMRLLGAASPREWG